MQPNERIRLLTAFSTLLALTFASRLLGPDFPTYVAVLMSLGALPALMLHWVRPEQSGAPTLLAAALLALPGLALALRLWHNWLLERGITPIGPLIGLALALVFVQAVALRAERQTHLAGTRHA